MDKSTIYWVIILLALVLFSGFINEITGKLVAVQETTAPACFDDDGGKNYYLKGTITGPQRCIYNGVTQDCVGGITTITEICVQGRYNIAQYGDKPQLNELFCGADGRISTQGTLCPSGYTCKDGACIKKGLTTQSTIRCTTDSNCPTGYKCLNGVCVKKSTVNATVLPLPQDPCKNIRCLEGQVCRNGNCVTLDYLNVIVEYVSSPGLDESGYSGVTTATKAIKISAPLDTAFALYNSKKTGKIWVTGDNKVFYQDKNANPQIQYLGNSLTGTKLIFKETGLPIGFSSDSTGTLVSISGLNEYLGITFSEATENIKALGNTAGLAESSEVTHIKTATSSVKEIGTLSTDYKMMCGIIVKTPASNGASDQVVLAIPSYLTTTQITAVTKS